MPLNPTFSRLVQTPSLTSGMNMTGTALGKTAERKKQPRRSSEADEVSVLDLQEALSRSMSVPKCAKVELPVMESAQTRGSGTDDPSPMPCRYKHTIWSLKASAEGLKRPFIAKKTPASVLFPAQISAKTTLLTNTSKSGLSPSPSLPNFPSDFEAQFLSSQRSVPKLDFSNRLNLYNRHFSAVIKSSGQLEPVLTRLKAGYEGLVEDINMRNQEETRKLKGEIEEWRGKYRLEAEEKTVLAHKIEKLKKENEELGEECNLLEAKTSKYESKLQHSPVQTPGFPPTFESYASLVEELAASKATIVTLHQEITALKNKEKKLALVVQNVKRRASQVEEMHERYRQEEDSYTGRLVDSMEIHRERPAAVPRLSLVAFKPGASSASQSSEHSSSTEGGGNQGNLEER